MVATENASGIKRKIGSYDMRMNRSFILRACAVLSRAFAIVGSVIGAGFVTGKEIAVFFAVDPSVSALWVCCLLFAAAFYFIGTAERGKFFLAAEKAVGLINVVVLSCMLSALAELFRDVLRLSENNLIFPILSLILSFFICRKGMGYIEKLSLLFLPSAVIAVLWITASSVKIFGTIPLSPVRREGRVMPLLYVGMNVLLSFPVIADAGGKEGRSEKMISSLLAAVTLVASVSLILCAVCGFFLSEDPMPLYRYSKEKGSAAYAAYLFVLIVGIYSTLFCSHYGLMKICRGKSANLFKIALSIAALALSRIGFEKIVGKVYPTVGAAGLALPVFLIVSRVVSRVKIRSHTFRRQERTEPRCLPLRDRV